MIHMLKEINFFFTSAKTFTGVKLITTWTSTKIAAHGRNASTIATNTIQGHTEICDCKQEQAGKISIGPNF